MELAYIKNGVVEKILIWNENPNDPNTVDVTNMSPKPGPGWSYDGLYFTPPIITIPETIDFLAKAKAEIQPGDIATARSTPIGRLLMAALWLLARINLDEV